MLTSDNKPIHTEMITKTEVIVKLYKSIRNIS